MAAEEVVDISRREQAKDERRVRIVQAALDLLREGAPNNITASLRARWRAALMPTGSLKIYRGDSKNIGATH